MELTSIYQRTDPRAQGQLKGYNQKAEENVGGTRNPIHQNGEQQGSTRNTRYLKIGPYTPPTKVEELVADHGSPVVCVTSFHPSFDKNGLPFEPPFIMTGSVDGSMTAWHMRTLEKMYSIGDHSAAKSQGKGKDAARNEEFIGHSDAITDMKVYQPVGELLIVVVSASKDKTIRLTQLQSGRCLGVLRGHTEAVWSIDILLQHNLAPIIISGSLDGTVCLWSMTDQKLVRRTDCGSGAILKTSIFCSSSILRDLREGETTFNDASSELLIMVASEKRTLSLWNMQTGLREREFKVHPNRITDFVSLIPEYWRFSDDEEFFKHQNTNILEGNGAKAERLEQERWAEYCDDMNDDMYMVYKHAITITACLDGRVRVFSVASGLLLRVLEDPDALVPTPVRSPVSSLRVYWPSEGKEDQYRPRVFTGVQGSNHFGIAAIGDFLKSAAELAANFGADEGEGDKDINEFKSVAAEPRILASFKNGSIISWDIMTGVPFRKYNMFTGDEEPSISSFLTDTLTEQEDRVERTHGAEVDGLYNKSDTLGASPIIFAAGFSGLLKRRHVRHRGSEASIAYEMDCKFKVSRKLSEHIPEQFRNYPRTYLLGQYFEGLHYLFAGPNYALLARASLDGNMGFLQTFLPYSKGGMVMASRARYLAMRDVTMDDVKEKWFHSYREGLNGVLSIRKICGLPWAFIKLITRAAKQLTEPEAQVNDTLLRIALSRNDVGQTKILMDMWSHLVNKPPKDLLDQTVGPHLLIDSAELVAVSKTFPELFEKFICSLQPVMSHKYIQSRCDMTIRPGKEVVFMGGGKHLVEEIDLWSDEARKKMKESGDARNHRRKELQANLKAVLRGTEKEAKRGQDVDCFYLPINNCCSEPLLNAMLTVGRTNDSTAMFDSPFGKNLVRFLWHAGGRKVHFHGLLYFVFDTLVSLFSIVAFTPPTTYDPAWERGFWIEREVYLILVPITVFIIGRLISLADILKADPETVHAYFRNFWTWTYITNKLFQVITNIVLLTFLLGRNPLIKDYRSLIMLRPFLAVLITLLFFRMLYFARALESTGLLIALIFEIVEQVWIYLLFILGFALITAQITWVLATYDKGDEDQSDQSDQTFNTFSGALLELVSWTFAGFNSDAYSSFVVGSLRSNFAVLIGAVYYFMAAIIMFNILIAFMTDIFDKVYQQGQAKWRAMQMSTVAENLYFRSRGYQDREKRRLLGPAVVHFMTRAVRDENRYRDEDQEGQADEAYEESVKRLKLKQRYYEKLHNKFGNRMAKSLKKLDEIIL